MNAAVMTLEMDAISVRTRKMMGVSLLVHAILLALLSLYREIQPGPLTLTEITWLEPGEESAATPSPPSPAPRAPERGVALKRSPTPEHFIRADLEADLQPDPQGRVAEDRLAERLASLQRESASRSPVAPALAVAGISGPAAGLASAGIGLPTGAPVGLARGGTGKSRVAPLEMTRSGSRPSAVVPAVVGENGPPPAPARKTAEGAAAQRTLAGATLLGPVADRKLLAFVQPRYPDWAKREGVEATVRIYFVVLETGVLKENVVVEKTSGYEDFDANGVEALRSWRFEPLPRGSAGEQWGEITFRYRLSEGSAG